MHRPRALRRGAGWRPTRQRDLHTGIAGTIVRPACPLSQIDTFAPLCLTVAISARRLSEQEPSSPSVGCGGRESLAPRGAAPVGNPRRHRRAGIMKINGRFLLLAVATGLFIRLWSNADGGRPRGAATTPPSHVVQSGGGSTSLLKEPPAGGTHPATIPHGEPATSPPTTSPTSKPVETATAKPVAPTPAAAPPGTPVRITEPGRVEDWTLERSPFRLPALSEGTWRVVDDTGRVALLNIPAGRGTGAGTVGEFHVHPVGGVRWYFIRLTTPQTAATPAPNPTPAATDLGVASTSVQDHSRGIVPTTVPAEATPTPAENAGVSDKPYADSRFAAEDLTNEQVVPQPPRVYTEAELAERAAVAVDLQAAAEAAASRQELAGFKRLERGPSKPRTSPAPTSKLRSCRAMKFPYCLCRCSTSSRLIAAVVSSRWRAPGRDGPPRHTGPTAQVGRRAEAPYHGVRGVSRGISPAGLPRQPLAPAVLAWGGGRLSRRGANAETRRLVLRHPAWGDPGRIPPGRAGVIVCQETSGCRVGTSRPASRLLPPDPGRPIHECPAGTPVACS